jgi:hypothetical protein
MAGSLLRDGISFGDQIAEHRWFARGDWLTIYGDSLGLAGVGLRLVSITG